MLVCYEKNNVNNANHMAEYNGLYNGLLYTYTPALYIHIPMYIEIEKVNVFCKVLN